MEIKNINGRNYNSIPTDVNTMIKKTEKFLDSSLTKFIDNITPIIMDYYAYDELASVTGVGDKTTYGPYSGATKYKVIKDYVGYGYTEERNTTIDKNEKEDIKMTSDVLSFLHLPNTINPTPNDRLTLKIENNQIFYYVTNIDYVTLHNKSYIKVDYIKDDNCPEQPWTLNKMKARGLISQELIFVQENLGTNYTPFLQEEKYNRLQELITKREEINEVYMSYFYDDYTNMLRFPDDKVDWGYSPLLYFYQMEYFPLKIYQTNDLMLSNEALEDKLTTIKWKTHPFRKFLKKKSPSAIESISLYKYDYFHKQSDPYFKVNSYMNSMESYSVYDITKNNDKKEIIIEPTEEIKDILSKWYHNEINEVSDILELLEDFYLEEITLSYMVYIPLVLTIIDNIYQEFYTRYSTNRFY
nr:MAG TPA: hypothetical protein [Caudoviricetes sp.]